MVEYCRRCGEPLWSDPEPVCADCLHAEERPATWWATYDRARAMKANGRRVDGRFRAFRSNALRAAWARGYADRHHNYRLRPPYNHRSHHGGTWGYQLVRAYCEGWECAFSDGVPLAPPEAAIGHPRGLGRGGETA